MRLLRFVALLSFSLGALAARADTLYFETSGAGPVLIAPTGDTVSLYVGTAILIPGRTNSIQSGSYFDSGLSVPNQAIPFTITETVFLTNLSGSAPLFKDIVLHGIDHTFPGIDYVNFQDIDRFSIGPYLVSVIGSATNDVTPGRTGQLELQAEVAETPEPSSVLLLGTGLLFLAAHGWRRARSMQV